MALRFFFRGPGGMHLRDDSGTGVREELVLIDPEGPGRDWEKEDAEFEKMWKELNQKIAGFHVPHISHGPFNLQRRDHRTFIRRELGLIAKKIKAYEKKVLTNEFPAALYLRMLDRFNSVKASMIHLESAVGHAYLQSLKSGKSAYKRPYQAYTVETTTKYGKTDLVDELVDESIYVT